MEIMKATNERNGRVPKLPKYPVCEQLFLLQLRYANYLFQSRILYDAQDIRVGAEKCF